MLWETPGVAIAVVKDGETIFAQGFGTRTIGKDDPVDADTLFAIGSTTKAFTAAAIGMLVDEGKLDWDDPVSEFLPEFQLFDPYATADLRVRDLLCHRSGLERADGLWYGTNRTRADILHQIRYVEPSWSFRSTWGYQNIMFLAAGQIVPKVAGESWDDFVRTRIFLPLGMLNSYTSTRDIAHIANTATPHEKIDEVIGTVQHRNIDNTAPAGSIYSSVDQMAEWLKLNLAKGSNGGEQLVSEAAMREIHSPQMVMPYEGRFALYSPEAHFLTYGLGWFVTDYKGRLSVHHGGAIDGMRAHVGLLPEENIGVVALCNLDGSLLPVGLSYWILDRILGEPETDWSQILFDEHAETLKEQADGEKKREDARVADAPASLKMEAYAGTYTNQLYGVANVEMKEGKLHATMSAGYAGKLAHWHYNTFEIDWDDATRGKTPATFRLNADAAVVGLTIEGLGEFERQLGAAK